MFEPPDALKGRGLSRAANPSQTHPRPSKAWTGHPTADFLPVMNEPQAVSGPAFAAIQRPPNTSLYFLQQVGGRRRRIFADFALFLAQFVKEPVEGLRHHLVADVPVLISGEGNGFVLRDQRVVLLGDAVSGHRILHHGAERGRELGRGLVLD